MKRNIRQKVLVIGLDSATFDIILPMAREGRLPNISRLINEGVSSVCDSVHNYNSAAAWTTITTGKNPGKHGIPGFFEFQPKSYSQRFINASFRKAEPLWLLLNRDKRSTLINIPFTYPPDEFNGILLPGVNAPDIRSDFAYPREILGEIEERFGDYVVEYPLQGSLKYKTAGRILRNIRSVEEKRKDTALYLMKKYPWDFFMIVFTALDRVGHFFWHCMDERHPQYDEKGAEAYRDVILKTYEDMDHLVGDILSKTEEDTTVILISDHGMGPLDLNNALSLNRWLCENGLMKLKSGRSTIFDPHIERMMTGIKRHLSPALKRYLKSMFFAQAKNFISRSILSGVDWSRTKAYVLPSVCLSKNIWINLEQRESRGIVKPGEEYENLRDLLKNKLNTLKSPTGEKLIKAAYRREEVYRGKYVDRLADIIIDFAEGAVFPKIPGNTRRNTASSNVMPWSGTHRLEGIFVAKGPDIQTGRKLSKTGIADLAPTILYSMDEKVPLSMDGRVLEEIFTETFRGKNPIKYIDDREILPEKEQVPYSPEESLRIKQRLKTLGYI